MPAAQEIPALIADVHKFLAASPARP